jgi:hypothetical protein
MAKESYVILEDFAHKKYFSSQPVFGLILCSSFNSISCYACCFSESTPRPIISHPLTIFEKVQLRVAFASDASSVLNGNEEKATKLVTVIL